LLGLSPFWAVVLAHLFGVCRGWYNHIVRLLSIQQPGNTHGIYLDDIFPRSRFRIPFGRAAL